MKLCVRELYKKIKEIGPAPHLYRAFFSFSHCCFSDIFETVPEGVPTDVFRTIEGTVPMKLGQ